MLGLYVCRVKKEIKFFLKIKFKHKDMQTKTIIFSMLVLLMSASCSPKFTVGADKDPEVDFSKYISFKEDSRYLFTKRSNTLLNSELTKKRVTASIDASLKEKGYEVVEKNPDFIFSFQTEVRSRQDVSYNNNNNPVWGYWSRWNAPITNQPTVRDYEEMTLIIDVKDAKSLELIWQGWVIGELKYSAETWASRIEETVRKAMSNFPSKTNGNEP